MLSGDRVPYAPKGIIILFAECIGRVLFISLYWIVRLVGYRELILGYINNGTNNGKCLQLR